MRFTFYHKLAKIELNITSGTGFDDSSVLEGLTVELTGQQTSATYDVIDGNEVAIVTETPRTVDLLVTNKGTKAEAIILPSDNFDEMSLKFKLKDGGHFIWPYNPISQPASKPVKNINSMSRSTRQKSA